MKGADGGKERYRVWMSTTSESSPRNHTLDVEEVGEEEEPRRWVVTG